MDACDKRHISTLRRLYHRLEARAAGSGSAQKWSTSVKPGDIIIIRPDVFHGWTKITDHVDYLSVRPDPNHVLPAGYVNPAIKK
jgi:hypothetical protein